MEIQKIRIDQAKPGMRLAEDVYTGKNELVLVANTVLDEQMIARFRQYGIYRFAVYLDEKEAKELREEDANQEATTKEKIRKSEEFVEFKRGFEDTVGGLKKSFGRILEHNDMGGLLQVSAQIDEIMKDKNGALHIMDMLNCMREYDDVTFAHSISVSLLSRLIGEWLHVSERDAHTLTMCGLLHDIGKLQIPNEIISKPGKLTDSEYAIVQQHPKLGYQLLKNQELDERVKIAALYHHERCDGKGYPLHRNGRDIELFSKIVMVADVYDAMTADRSYRAGMCPVKVLDILQEDGYEKYDAAVLLTFLEKTMQSYIHSTVELSDQRIGEIVSLNQTALTRPLVRVSDTFVDLTKEKDLKIVKIL